MKSHPELVSGSPGQDTIKITITISPFESWNADLLMAEMAELGFESFVEIEGGFEAYMPENSFNPETLDMLLEKRKPAVSIHRQMERIQAINWNEEWEKNYFQPSVISNTVVVRAPFHHDYPECPVEIVIEPNMAFGTGHHETTALMMETMLEIDFTGKTLLDMGCGTGILAILASKRGASAIRAIDTDRWAVDAVNENLIINNTLNITSIAGDASAIGSMKFDILLVNIQKNVILADMVHYAKALQTGGTILFSGFFETDLPEIIASAESQGLTFLSKKERNNWVVAVFKAG